MEGSGKSEEEHREEVPKDVGKRGRNLERRRERGHRC